MNNSQYFMITSLSYRLKAAEHELEMYRSGDAYTALRKEYDALVCSLKREINKLRKERDDFSFSRKQITRQWTEVLDDVKKEYEKEIDQYKKLIVELLDIIASLKNINAKLSDKKKELLEKIYDIGTKLEEAEGIIKKLTAQINHDYENSSLPSSKCINRKKITNNREKTGRKPGAQPGHPHHPRKKMEPDTIIEIPNDEKHENNKRYVPTEEIISRQVIGIAVVPIVTEYQAMVFYDKKKGRYVHAKFPAGVKDDVNYSESMKAFLFMLNSRCNVSLEKTAQFVSDITEGALSPSVGMINGLCREFSLKSKEEQDALYKALLDEPIMHVDGTSARVNGNNNNVLVCSNGEATMYFAKENKGHAAVKDTPVENFGGILIHDHESCFYSYGSDHQECLVHIERYLKDSIENEKDLTWNKDMLELIREMIHENNISSGGVSDEKIAEFEERYDTIVKTATREYEYSPPSDYYKNGYNLYQRMVEYKHNHLLFLSNPLVEPDNNLCERKARILKGKFNQSISVRSFEHLTHFCECLSVIDHFATNDEGNLYKSIQEIFKRSAPVAPKTNSPPGTLTTPIKT